MNSLDFVAQHEFRRTLSRLARAGKGLLLVTHQISDIIPEIKRIVLMKDGRFVAVGSRKEMLAPAMLKRIYGVTLDLDKRLL
jgi:iron complex transport system ATP-binding protein